MFDPSWNSAMHQIGKEQERQAAAAAGYVPTGELDRLFAHPAWHIGWEVRGWVHQTHGKPVWYVVEQGNWSRAHSGPEHCPEDAMRAAILGKTGELPSGEPRRCPMPDLPHVWVATEDGEQVKRLEGAVSLRMQQLTDASRELTAAKNAHACEVEDLQAKLKQADTDERAKVATLVADAVTSRKAFDLLDDAMTAERERGANLLEAVAKVRDTALAFHKYEIAAALTSVIEAYSKESP